MKTNIMKILKLLLHIIMLSLQYQTGFSFPNNSSFTTPLCRQEQKQLLLQLKQQLQPQDGGPMFQYCPEHQVNSYKTMFWNMSSDCCLWDGVQCDLSGHVIGLDLSCGILSGIIDSNSSIFSLSHLRKLNLAYNVLAGSEISSKFGRLNSLTHLNFSMSGIGGTIPLEFYHLSNLISLDMPANNVFGPQISCDINMLLGNMTKIRVLLLDGVNISSEMPMNMSSFLTHLDLSDTGIYGKLPVTIFEKLNLQVLKLHINEGLEGTLPKRFNRSNVHWMKELDLSATGISGRLPESIGFMKNLKYMGLQNCNFSGPVPESIGNITETTYINLSGNELSGHIPTTISNLRQLTELYLSGNHLQGQLPDVFSNLQKLTFLDCQYNSLGGPIPPSLTNMSELEYLNILSNALAGPFPSGAGNGLQKLSYMDFSHNSIKGMIPSWMLTLPSLQSLSLSFNRLTGQTGIFNCTGLGEVDLSNNQLNIELESFYNLSKLQHLSLSYNTVTKHAPEIATNVTLSNLVQLELSSCEIEEYPNLLRYLPNISVLDLSNNRIQNPIPNWFASTPLISLNLSTNYITYLGSEPWLQLENLIHLDLHSNSLRGTFPSSICNMSQLIILNLSDNKLRGKIPECIGNSSSSLWVLDLRRNQFYGKIPTTIGGTFIQLGNLGLNENQLEGPLPRSLANCTNLEVVDLGNNIIQDTFPWWLQTLPQLKILILKSNRFHGSIRPPPSNDSFTNLRIIDLSHNNFVGLLPDKLFTTLQAMKIQDGEETHSSYLGSELYHYSVTLTVKGQDVQFTNVLRTFTTIDFSSNDFHGRIPESIAYLYSLRLLNLSHNSINGSIPRALGCLTNLEQLDLSNNQITGGIPQDLTNLTFLAVLNLSHNHLVGPIPQVNQFPTFSNDSYVGNSGLCGAPLTKTCGDDKAPAISIEEVEEDSGFMMGFTWKAVVMGYGCGILLGFILGNVMISTGKPKWLARFVYVEAAICLNRRKKRGPMAAQGRR